MIEVLIEKLTDYALLVFTQCEREVILNNARKSGEAVAKIVIAHSEKENITTNLNAHYSLNSLISLLNQKDKKSYIQCKTSRDKVLSSLDTLRTFGNPASHLNLHSTVQDDIDICLKSLNYVLGWLFYEYLKEQIPEPLIPYVVTDRAPPYPKINDVRAVDVVRQQFPNIKIQTQFKVNDSSNNIHLEFITTHIDEELVKGFLFLDKDTNMDQSIKYFFEHVNVEICNLTICTPKVYKSDGSLLGRKHTIEKKFSDISARYFNLKSYVFYIEDYLWKQCLLHKKDKIIQPIEEVDHFIDQDVFSNESNQTSPKNSPPKTLKNLIHGLLNPKPGLSAMMLLVGKAGTGKTTASHELARRINKSNKEKVAILFSSFDLCDTYNDAVWDHEVSSITDLYKLYNHFKKDKSECLDDNAFELNVSCGNIIVVIDGLDEIQSLLKNKFNINKFIDSCSRLNSAFRNCTIVATSRTYHIQDFVSHRLIQTYELIGFNEIRVREYFCKRLHGNEGRVRHAQSIISEFSYQKHRRQKYRHTDNDNTKTGIHYIPLIASLIADLVEREDYTLSENDNVPESHYFHHAIPIDNLIYKVLCREIGKQNLENISCDQYFELMCDIAIDFKGYMSDGDMLEHAALCFPCEEEQGSIEELHSKFGDTPFITYEKNKGFCTSNSLDVWIKSRFLYHTILHQKDIGRVKPLVASFADGTGHLFKELTKLFRSNRIHLTSKISLYVKQLVLELKKPQSATDKILLQKSISGFLYLAITCSNTTCREAHTNVLVEVFGTKSISNLCIFGDFFALDFSDLIVQDSKFVKYSNFNKCKFPENKTVFLYCIFSEVFADIHIKLSQSLFDSTCKINDELLTSIDAGHTIKASKYNQCLGDIRKLLKVGFSSGGFSAVTEELIKQRSNLNSGVNPLVLLKFLLRRNVMEVKKEGANVKYIVSKGFRPSANKLITQNIALADIDEIICLMQKELYSTKKSFDNLSISCSE